MGNWIRPGTWGIGNGFLSTIFWVEVCFSRHCLGQMVPAVIFLALSILPLVITSDKRVWMDSSKVTCAPHGLTFLRMDPGWMAANVHGRHGFTSDVVPSAWCSVSHWNHMTVLGGSYHVLPHITHWKEKLETSLPKEAAVLESESDAGIGALAAECIHIDHFKSRLCDYWINFCSVFNIGRWTHFQMLRVPRYTLQERTGVFYHSIPVKLTF